MGVPVLFPSLDKFGGAVALRLIKRWWINIPTVANAAGVKPTRLGTWLKGARSNAHFPERGAVYDALLTEIVKQAAWAAEEAKRLRAARDAHFAKVRGRAAELQDGDHPV